jgi:hypothetical protein
VHAAAWKRLFDEFLEKRSIDTGEPFVPFDVDTDYRRHVDGKPRADGVKAFLDSRDIELAQGAQEDGPGVQSVRTLGNPKASRNGATFRSPSFPRRRESSDSCLDVRSEDHWVPAFAGTSASIRRSRRMRLCLCLPW